MLMVIILLIIKHIKSQNQIYITINSIGTHYLFCDDNINIFESSDINVFKIHEDIEIDIKKFLIKKVSNDDDNICKNRVYYSIEYEYEKIKIEFKIFPEYLHNLFRGSSLDSIEIITNLDNSHTNGKTDFSNMFQDCLELTSVDLSNYNFCNVKTLNSMFSGCKNLQFFNLPKNLSINCINFENADFTEMFSGCSSLTSIDLSYITVNGINNINNMFLDCSNIESIILKGNLLFENVENNKCINIAGTLICLDNIKIEIFPKINSLKIVDLFDMNVNLSYIELENLNSLEECLYFEQYNNIKKCKKYIGFHLCGKCLNENIDYYCTKLIEGEYYNFYYLEHQKNLAIENRECYWSNNFNNFLTYRFLNNGEEDISYYTYNNEYCESFFYETGDCLRCNNHNKYYKIENTNNICSNFAPADNYVLDIEANEWRKCNKRCKKCHVQSRSEIDHQCIECSNYFYPYKIDYDNYKNNKVTGFSCYSYIEVSSKYLNYFLNSNNQFEKCDISCEQCSKEKNNCIKCSQNYYNIYGYENGTCFHYPLPKYGLIIINSQTFFKPCFHLCKYCNFITQSFLYQQCTECDEDYTLDLYSLNQSYCIPKDYNNTYFIREKRLWYIDNIKELEIINNEDILIDYGKILNKEKYYNLTFKFVDKCEGERPFTIYSIRQCVSSCKSSNLVEKGIFMTKKLYLYNNICYDVCPYGSEKNYSDDTCIEKNEHTSINATININLFKKDNQINILKYLSEFSHNSIGILRANDFSNYFYKQSTNYSYQLNLSMPIFDFGDCITKIKNNYNLDNNNIFYGIIEYNGQNNKNAKYNQILNLINSTEYQSFLENGTILNFSVCKGTNFTIEKKVEVSKININELKNIKNTYNISLFDKDSKELNDYCLPFSINNKDLTLYDRKKLFLKYGSPCDDGCSFSSFNFETNYSTCICTIKNEEKTIGDKIKEELNDIDEINILKHSNIKYFKCGKIFFSFNRNINILFIFSIIFVIFHLILLIISIIDFYNKKKPIIDHIPNNKNSNHNINKQEIDSLGGSDNNQNKIKNNNFMNTENNINNDPNKNINQSNKVNTYKKNINNNEEDSKEKESEMKNSENLEIKEDKDKDSSKRSKNIENSENKDKDTLKKSKTESEKKIQYESSSENSATSERLNISKWPKEKHKEKKEFPFWSKLKKKSFKIKKKINNLAIYLMLILFVLHSFLFFNAILFSNEYISMRYTYKQYKLIYIITREYDRIFYSFLFTNSVMKFYILILKINKKYLTFILFPIIILLLHILYLYFLKIFGDINPHIVKELLVSTFFLIIFYLIVAKIVVPLIITIIKEGNKEYYKKIKNMFNDFYE